jgi:CTP:molybdopterin cytidylyltransferase MocA
MKVFEDLCVILLAAGSASRFGSPKLLADVHGRPMLVRAIETLLEVARQDRIVVVLGANADRLEPLVRGVRVCAVINRDHADGMASSIRTGLTSVPSDSPGVLIALADQLAVTPGDLRRLVEAWREHPERVAAARHGEAVGVPAIFPAPMFDQLAQLQGDRGARDLLKREAGHVTGVPMPTAAVDVDTPADLAAVVTMLGR